MQALTVFSGEKPLIVFPHNPERLAHQKMYGIFCFSSDCYLIFIYLLLLMRQGDNTPLAGD